MDISGLIPTDPGAQLEWYVKSLMADNKPLNLGPRILGLTADLALLGVALHQFSLYMGYPGKDRLYVKATVYWIMAVAVGTSVFSLYYIWWIYVAGFGTYTRFLTINRLGWFSLLDICTTGPVQVFYLERAYKLHQRKKWILFLAAPLILCTVVSAICLMVFTQIAKTFADAEKMKPFFYLWNTASLTVDALLTGLIICGLAKAKTGWSDTDKIVTSLIRMSVETQLPSTMVALGFMLNYSIDNGSQVNYFWVMCHTKIYTVSLLAVLNFRMQLRPASDWSAKDRNNTLRSGRVSAGPIDRIQVNTVTYAESHATPAFRIGLNRQRTQSDSDDEIKPESAASTSDYESSAR